MSAGLISGGWRQGAAVQGPNLPYYIHCKAGARSLQAVQFLREQGFKNLKSVKGGIDAWSDQVDPTVPKY